MILVKRRNGDSNLKVYTVFNQRTRKANTKTRYTKIQTQNKPVSHLKKKRKAVKKAAYLQKKQITDRLERNKF